MSGDVHVRFWEGAGVRFPRATHLPLYRSERMLARFGVADAAVRLEDLEQALDRWTRQPRRAVSGFAEPATPLVLQVLAEFL